MALAIKIVPTLEGDDARKFEMAAKEVESNPYSQDYTQQARIMRKFLRKRGEYTIGWLNFPMWFANPITK